METLLGLIVFWGIVKVDYMRVYFGFNGDFLGESWFRVSLYGFWLIELLVRYWIMCVVIIFLYGDCWVFRV